jgi:NitT/TauT family transport system substrate-binding protein
MRLLVAVLIVLALAAGEAPAQQEKALHPFTVGVGGQGQLAYLPVTLAQSLGYYRDAGLAVDIVNFQGGTKAVQALVGGSVDAMAGAYDNAVILQGKGVYLTTVFTFVDRYGYVFGMTPAKAALYHEPKDLKGMKIGVSAFGASTESMVRLLIAKGGLGNDDVVTMAVGTGAGAVAAIETGQIDGVVTGDPEISRMTMDHKFTALVDTRTRAGMDYIYGGEAAGAGSLMMDSFIKAHPDLVQAYINALYRAHRWLVAATPEAVAAEVPPSLMGGDPALYKVSLAANRDSFTPDGRTTMTRAQVTYRSMVRAGRLPETQKIDFARSFDDSFVERAAH